ncbi:MAG: hypothetical protein PUP92_15385 [Rhizonema sp. PD38]|nr:hypothetical protein [Rhizonema sp. PD38]
MEHSYFGSATPRNLPIERLDSLFFVTTYWARPWHFSSMAQPTLSQQEFSTQLSGGFGTTYWRAGAPTALHFGR